jgi:hypothetical protein
LAGVVWFIERCLDFAANFVDLSRWDLKAHPFEVPQHFMAVASKLKVSSTPFELPNVRLSGAFSDTFPT